jgi:hypothetical protein
METLSQFNTAPHDQIEASLLKTVTLLHNILPTGLHQSLTAPEYQKYAMTKQNIPTVILEFTESITFPSIPQTSTLQMLNN